jgi:preprotein translocase subunit SecE
VNRQTKRQMAKSGMDKPSRPERKAPVTPTRRERVTPAQYLSEVQGELKKVAWPSRPEVSNSTMIVLIAVLFMTGLIFVVDWSSVHFVNWLYG